MFHHNNIKKKSHPMSKQPFVIIPNNMYDRYYICNQTKNKHVIVVTNYKHILIKGLFHSIMGIHCSSV